LLADFIIVLDLFFRKGRSDSYRGLLLVRVRPCGAQFEKVNGECVNFLKSLSGVMVRFKIDPSESLEAMISHGLTHRQMHESIQIFFEQVCKLLPLDVHWNVLQVQSHGICVE
jgi:hypothetical protein